MFSNNSGTLLENSRRNIEPGTPKVATDQRRYFPLSYFHNSQVSSVKEHIETVFFPFSIFSQSPPVFKVNVVFLWRIQSLFFRLF